MANWQPIGSVEVCVGTDGVVGVSFDGQVAFCVSKKTGLGWDSKTVFEERHCKPRHRLIESADGSVCVVSTEEVDGKPVRMAFVRTDSQGEWDVHWMGGWDVADDKQDAIDRAARYVETGE